MPAPDLTGQTFARLTAIQLEADGRWLCRCECGGEARVAGGSLRSGHTRSCGCFKAERMRVIHLKHGHARGGRVTVEYKTWGSVISRCEDPSSTSYPRYGAVGVTVCARWRESFEAFLADMGPRPGRGYSIDRKDSSRGYEPDNCRWVTRPEQNRNRKYQGRPVLTEEQREQARRMRSGNATLSEIAAVLGISKSHACRITA